MRLFRGLMIFLFLGVMLSAGVCLAEDFSADMVSVTPQDRVTAKFYSSGKKMRMEMLDAISIIDIDKKLVWILMPAQMMYMEQALDTMTAISTQEKVEGEISRTALGPETINGVLTTKYQVVYKSQGKTQSMFQWLAKTMKMPVKSAAVDGSWSTEFMNIKAGPQSQQLFQIPAGYEKMSMGMPDMSEMFKSMGEE